MHQDFEIMKALMLKIARQSSDEQRASVYSHRRGMPLANDRDFEHLVYLYENGFVEALDASDKDKRELRSPKLTSDGRDLLDAMQSPDLWTRVQRAADLQGMPLTLKTVKAAVAAAITGGFNA
jgi:hypothetical protein